MVLATATVPPQPPSWTEDTAKTRYSLVSSSTSHEDGSPLPSPSPKKSVKRAPLEIQSITRKRPRKYIKLIICCLAITLIATPWIKMTLTVSKHGKNEPNPPPLPESMAVFHPPKNEHERQALQSKLDGYSDPILYWEEFANSSSASSELHNHPEFQFTYTSRNHFASQRTALLFAPGTYPVDVEIGYYTSLYGLGTHPTRVTFTGRRGPHVPALDKFTDRPPFGSGLNTFWRSVENIATRPKDGMTWAVSQAAPLRRMHIMGDLNLFDAGAWLSGGMGANLLVDGIVNFGSQQQFVMRNVHFDRDVVGGAWSLVFVGCTGKVPDATISLSEPGPAVSVEEFPRVRMEKPYIVVKDQRLHKTEDGQNAYNFELRVPKVMTGNDANGPHFEESNDEIRDFCRVKLGIPSASPDSTNAAIENHSTLQKALDQGKDLVLSPGIYPLSSSLEVKHPNQVILGLGYATLLAPTNGMPCIYIHPRVPGVRIAGVMLEASVLSEEGLAKNSSLLQWGDEVLDDGDAANPGLLSDVFARVGSLDRTVSTDTMIIIHSGNIIGDNLWLWRADHVALHPGEKANFPQISPLYRQTVVGECEVKTGLIVNGTNVTIFGLAVEHTLQDQVIWNGEDGAVYFYQSELPYDVDKSFADGGYVGYRVNTNVTHHTAYGIGIYSNFRDTEVIVDTAVVTPGSGGIDLKHIFTVKLDNMGKIGSIVNGRGPGPNQDTERGVPFRCLDGSCL